MEKTKEWNHTTNEQKSPFWGIVIITIIIMFLCGMCNGLAPKTTKRTDKETLQFILDCEQFDKTKFGKFIKKAEGR